MPGGDPADPGAPTIDGVQRELREALQDPSLNLWVWLPGEATYIDAQGNRKAFPLEDAASWPVTVRASDGEHLAVLVLDPALQRHASLVESAVVAGGLALENGRLHADIQAQLDEVSASRERIAEAAVDERRRLERDLHDGAQQSLLAATASLSVARVKAHADPEVMDAIERARIDLRTALGELRHLARGIHPAVLSQSGVLPAVEGVAERLPILVDLHIPDQRWAPRIEATIYFLICEALSNVVKHANANRVTVSIETQETEVCVRVEDDGRG